MLFLRTNPTGIDYWIQTAQQQMYNDLLTAWDLQGTAYECYGRCYRNKKKNGYIAECYVGGNTNQDYNEVFLNDTLAALSFFSVSQNIKVAEDSNTANVALIFFTNLSLLSPGNDRADETIRNTVIQTISEQYGLNLTGIQIGCEKVLSDYPGTRLTALEKGADMHPYHCFRLDYTLIYDSFNTYSITPINQTS